MEKDFQNWHKKKAEINNIPPAKRFFREREIWFCRLGVNVGFEQDGKGEEFLRPVIVFKKFNSTVFWAIPLTKSQKKIRQKVTIFYFPFSFLPGTQSVAILSQIRLLDAKRLTRPIGFISQKDFKKLTEKLKELFP